MIAIDVDEVLIDFMGGIREAFRKTGLTDYTGTGKWDVYSDFTEAQRLVFNVCKQKPDFCNSLKVFPHALDVLENLRKLDKVVALTAPWSGSATWYNQRHEALEALGFSAREIVFCPGELKASFDCDILIEDKVATLVAWAERHPEALGICLDTPWNHAEVKALEPYNVFRAAKPEDIYRIARKDYEGK